MLLLVINAANGIVDSLFASNFIGKDAMGAIGFYAPVNHFLFALSIMLLSGAQMLLGKSLARNKMDAVQQYFSVDLILAAGISIITAVLMILIATFHFTRLMVADNGERLAMNRYILGQSFGVPALVLGQQLFAFLSMENQKKRTMIASLCCIAANTAMNTLFVVVFRMGTLGLGIGSSLGCGHFLPLWYPIISPADPASASAGASSAGSTPRKSSPWDIPGRFHAL